VSARVLRWVIVGLLVVGGLAFLAVGANGPADPSLKAAEGAGSIDRRPFGGFAEIGFRIEGSSAQAGAARCALLAETAAQQERGLMERRDLGGYDGMLFKFTPDHTGEFYMRNTPLPLSIAFFDASGQFVSATDMAPCIDMPACPTYGAARPYQWALEVPQGTLLRLGIGPGSRLVAGGPCS
jgi:uncharacterized membrane protein (UPF0127 family)